MEAAASERHEAIVIGAGPAGLDTAATLKLAGVPNVVLDRAEAVGSAWRTHYERLHLHTVRWLSNLPGYPIPRRHGRWVARDDVVSYLEDYARHHRLDVRLGTEVQRIERDGDRWRVQTSSGDLTAPYVVVASGFNHTPQLPDLPGRDGFEGELLHAKSYRNAQPYRGRDVLVVGTGNTGAEIVVDLDEGGVGELMLSVRTAPHVLHRSANGIPSQLGGMLLSRLPSALGDPLASAVERATVGDLSRYGMPRPDQGLLSDFRARDRAPILDVGLIRLLKKGRVEVLPAVEGFDGPTVLLRGGRSVEPDAVIAATGFLKGLEPLVGHLGVLDENGAPRHCGGEEDPSAPGLHFIGYINPLSGRLWSIRSESRRIADAVAAVRQAVPA